MSNKELITEFLLVAEQDNSDGPESYLDKKVDTNATNHEGRTAIIIVSLNKHCSYVPSLISAGADINRQDQTCLNPFLIGCLNNDLILLRTMLPANPDLNCLTCSGGVNIISAYEKGHVEIVHELLICTDIGASHANLVGWMPFLGAIVLNNGGEK